MPRVLHFLEDFGQKKCLFFLSKTVFLEPKCTTAWHVLHIILSYICKFATTRKNDAFVAKIAITRLTKISWPFLRSPEGCQLVPEQCWSIFGLFQVGNLRRYHLCFINLKENPIRDGALRYTVYSIHSFTLLKH